MIDYLKGRNPEEEPKEDEDDSEEVPLAKNSTEGRLSAPENEDIPEPDTASPFAVGALNPDLAAAAEKHQHQVAEEDDATATTGLATQAIRTKPRTKRTKPHTRPTVNRIVYAVGVSLNFRISVPDDVTAEQITAAFQNGGHLTLGANPPFDYELSDMAVTNAEVGGTDGSDQFQPENVPGTDAAPE